MSDVKQDNGTWIFLVPMSGLELTEAVNFEFRIDRITFVNSGKLPNRRRRFGIPQRISAYRQKHKKWLTSFFDSTQCFATLRQTGKLVDFEKAILELIREETAILAFSQLGYGKRQQNSSPSISDENPKGRRSYLAINQSKNSWTQPNKLIGGVHSLRLDENWTNFQENSFFYDFLRIIRNEIRVNEHWRRDLRNAAIFAGQSQTIVDLPQAFLWNVIALELLLTEHGDSYTKALPTRAEAFLGWTGHWKLDGFEEKIRSVYKKRSALVHAGQRELITPEDLFFTDDLLFNLFINIVKHHRIFKSKKALIEFSEKVQAEHLLGVNSRVRPKTLRYLQRFYTPEDHKM